LVKSYFFCNASARFFDSYLQSKLNEALDPYLVLLGSASYYLCDLPGSASVLAKRKLGRILFNFDMVLFWNTILEHFGF
jgi:hypothetical protein